MLHANLYGHGQRAIGCRHSIGCTHMQQQLWIYLSQVVVYPVDLSSAHTSVLRCRQLRTCRAPMVPGVISLVFSTIPLASATQSPLTFRHGRQSFDRVRQSVVADGITRRNLREAVSGAVLTHHEDLEGARELSNGALRAPSLSL